MARLTKEDFACCAVDLSIMGVQASLEGWYVSILKEITKQLEMPVEVVRWWQERDQLTPAYRFSLFVTEELVHYVSKKIVLFFDEIDSVLSLDKGIFNTDDFFAVIRGVYNQRGDKPAVERINVVILGVASPNDLMNDPLRTPFNTATAIHLDNFTIEESAPLEKGFLDLKVDPHVLLKEILYWTNGQPVLTQRLCIELANEVDLSDLASTVTSCVHRLFLDASLNQGSTNNLSTIDFRIRQNTTYGLGMLEVYRAILEKRPVKDETTNPIFIYLKLSGLVRAENGLLLINNRIYEHKFDINWVNTTATKIFRPYAASIKDWLENGKSDTKALKGDTLDKYNEWCNNRNDLTPMEKEYQVFCNGIRNAEETIARMNELLITREREMAANAEAQRKAADAKERVSNRIRRLLINISLGLFAVFVVAIFYLLNLNKSILVSRAQQISLQKQKDSSQLVIVTLDSINGQNKQQLVSLRNALSAVQEKRNALDSMRRSYDSQLVNLRDSSMRLIDNGTTVVNSLNGQKSKLDARIAELDQQIYSLNKLYSFKRVYRWLGQFTQDEQDSIYAQYVEITDTNEKKSFLRDYYIVSSLDSVAATDANKAVWIAEKISRRLRGGGWIVDKRIDSLKTSYIFYDHRFHVPDFFRRYETLSPYTSCFFSPANEFYMPGLHGVYAFDLKTGDSTPLIQIPKGDLIFSMDYDAHGSRVLIRNEEGISIYNLAKKDQPPISITVNHKKFNFFLSGVFFYDENNVIIRSSEGLSSEVFYLLNARTKQYKKIDKSYITNIISQATPDLVDPDLTKVIDPARLDYFYSIPLRAFVVQRQRAKGGVQFYLLDPVGDSVRSSLGLNVAFQQYTTGLWRARCRYLAADGSRKVQTYLYDLGGGIDSIPYISRYDVEFPISSADGKLLLVDVIGGTVLYDRNDRSSRYLGNNFSYTYGDFLTTDKFVTIADSTIQVWKTKPGITGDFDKTYVTPFAPFFERDSTLFGWKLN